MLNFVVHHTTVGTWQGPEIGFDMILADSWIVDEISEVVRSLVLDFWMEIDASNKSGLSSDSCPDSWIDGSTSNKSVVSLNEYGSSLGFSDDRRSSKVTSNTAALRFQSRI